MAYALLKNALLGHRLMSSSFSVSRKPPQVLATLFTGQFHCSATSEPVISADWLHENKNNPNVKVLDASWYMSHKHRNPIHEYQVAHIPGAVFFDICGISDKNTNLTHILPSEKAFSMAVSALGIQNKNDVVVYDGSGIFSAARVWWMFRVFGHERVWVLDGGLPTWRESGFDVESSACDDLILRSSAAIEAVEKIYKGQLIAPITFETKFQQHLFWTLDQVKKNINEKTYQHIDGRSKARFDGTAPEPRKWIGSGHVPGSKCIPFGRMLNASHTLLPANELKKQFVQEGVSLDNPIFASSGTGITACILALGLYRLGKKDVPIYDGSWMEWREQSINSMVEKFY